MRRRPASKPTPSQADALSGLTPGMRMKGGVRYDPAVHGFVAIIHSWDNVACHCCAWCAKILQID